MASVVHGPKNSSQERLAVTDMEVLVAAGVGVIFGNPEPGRPDSHPPVTFKTLLVDISKHSHNLSKLSPTAVDGVLRGLQTWCLIEFLPAVFQKLGEPWSTFWNQPLVQERLTIITPSPASETTSHTPVDEASQPPTPSSDTFIPTYRISTPASQEVDGYLNDFRTASPTKAFEKFLIGYSVGLYPTIATLGRLINALGRSGEIENVNFVYEVAQHALTVNKPLWGEDPNGSWFHIEDHMIVALAYAGDVEGAHNHRLRIIGCGGTPSADAYGALIGCVKDTTDDSANAYSLYRESQIRGVIPNVYLYNTVISKLAKARKVDLAMELFSKMKENGFWPSSVSYGAVIGACSRVGDVESAEALFKEMSSQPNFKPRVPPFNTMMQLYTYTKRNRDKVLHYYDAMISAGVRPTAHTYKLLMDAYATIDPSNITAMEQTFAALCTDRSVQVLGTHWGSLINAYGCVQKDLNRAIEVFEGIASHPSTQKGTPMPDAVAYKALTDVFANLRRADLVPVYMDRFWSSRVHSTVRIANLPIKGHTGTGDQTKARREFASPVDLPTRVTAPYNHPPHKLDLTAPIHPSSPCHVRRPPRVPPLFERATSDTSLVGSE